MTGQRIRAYMLQARRWPALCLSVHHPLAASASPSGDVLFCEWLHRARRRSCNRPLARALDEESWPRCSPVGVITAQLLSFEYGLCGRRFTRLRQRGSGSDSQSRASLLLEAILSYYVYGWVRLSPRSARPQRHPDREAPGSPVVMVIAVKLDEHPTGLARRRARHRRATR